MTLNVLIGQVTAALAEAAARRGGPVPALSPEELSAHVRDTLGEVIPERGTGPAEAAVAIAGLLAFGGP
ncbi:MAG: aspartate aminotransferase family protein, partial [Nonomuraea sp.]|nr:aspartate aminotransferase family protein [Nonomuraea sp.]